ncbi:MAG TPA: HD domain-containing protein [Pirellulales bacterium]|nr:HD domain-containing protein [Pirellulales bacterium]
MRDYQLEALSHDPIHGYIAFSNRGAAAGEVAERDLIDHPWVQRLRQIHQLQTAWWVFPSAEHTRFQHVLGAMHLASRAVEALYDSLAQVCPDLPSRGYVETLMRLAALLHDVGHGPFGHFFDDHFLSRYGLTHETLGSKIIRDELGDLLRGVRRNPHSRLDEGEGIDPDHVTCLITRPRLGEVPPPLWLRHLRSLFSGLYTVDNMDFVLRDAYMSGYNTRAFDLVRLLHYSFFSERGLTVHARGLPELIRFMGVRAELFRSLYFHRTVRAIDLDLADLFDESRDLLFRGNPLDHLGEYQGFTEWSLLVDVARWVNSDDTNRRELGRRWQMLLARHVRWKMACERTLFFSPGVAESSSLFSEPQFVERALRAQLPPDLRDLPLRVDLARLVHRPGTQGPAAGQNFLFDPGRNEIRELTTSELFRQLPLASRICRIYALSHEHDATLAAALDALVEPNVADQLTNM